VTLASGRRVTPDYRGLNGMVIRVSVLVSVVNLFVLNHLPHKRLGLDAEVGIGHHFYLRMHHC